MTIITGTDTIKIEKYKPTIWKPFLVEMEQTTILRRIRFLIDWYYGYSVYYLKEGDTFYGYCTITSGKNPRFWFANSSDIIIGPYFIEDSQRGKGYATKLVDAIINQYETNWGKAYVVIKNKNIASIKVTKHLGGELVFHVHNTLTKKLIKKDNGEYGIFVINHRA